ncbi:PTS fructose transporter subunit IIABC [Mycoplasmopsis sturni]|uniref:PTS fructose transporter subunit IIABC n=1 Tax=Mycoplasmopsis sturni TaxID=39047 RepID=UPI00068A498A|nr:fructose-specific PTS transporter subunit EIIC [Mycoplasmopsis sturni]
MEIKDLLQKDLFLKDQSFASKTEALDFFAQTLKNKGYAKDAATVLELALKREGEFSTGIGNQIAIPHIRNNVMNKPVILFAQVKPIDWNSLDNQDVEVVFFIALDEKSGANSHLEVIANLSRKFIDEDFVNKLKEVQSYEELIKLLSEEETQTTEETTPRGYDVVAITACPTGIAHTFMAAEKLQKAAQKMGIKIKVETQGTEGPKNVLTQEEINNAKGVIIAVDKVVDLSRFSGKENVLEMGTKNVIKDAEKEIQNILDNKGKTMAGNKLSGASGNTQDAAEMVSFKNFGGRIYKGLMNGVSYMLPFVIFGGIMIALGFLIDINNAGNANYGSGNNASLWFNRIGGISFGLMVPILAAYMAYGLVGKFGLLPGFLTGMMASGKFIMSLNPETGTVGWFEPSNVSSGFFGAIGGAIFTAVVLIFLLKYVFAKLPQSLNGIKNILFVPLFGTLIIVAAFWVLNIPFIYLNYGFTKLLEVIAKYPALLPLLGLVLGIMMALDLGGPINKAAYVFGTATLSAAGGNGTVAMAAVMASGMVPPLGVALAATFFKKLYTKEERQGAYTNYIMGLSFISEGAIPYTAERPKVMVPANLIGGAIAGILVGIFQIKLNAPHGGIFVFALVETSLLSDTASQGAKIGVGIALYLVSIIAGAVASMLAIWFLTKWFNKKSNNQTNLNEESKKAKRTFVFRKKTISSNSIKSIKNLNIINKMKLKLFS